MCLVKETEEATQKHTKNATEREKHENNNFQRKLNIRGVKNTNVASRCKPTVVSSSCVSFYTEKGVELFEERKKKLEMWKAN